MQTSHFIPAGFDRQLRTPPATVDVTGLTSRHCSKYEPCYFYAQNVRQWFDDRDWFWATVS